MELAYTKAYCAQPQPSTPSPPPEPEGSLLSDTENIFPSLRPHQKVLLVPGTFGCKDIGLAKSDELVAEKLELYLQWAESDTRIAGFNPWQCVPPWFCALSLFEQLNGG